MPDPQHPLGDGEIAPMGGLWTTVAEPARWTSFLAADDTDDVEDRGTGLSAATRREMATMHTWAGTASIAGRSGPSGYCFGLRRFVDAELGALVDHSGGLPGYGSNMRWAAGRGVAAIALANVTYAPMADLTMQLLVELHRQGVLQAEPAPDAPLLREASSRLVELLSSWSDETATVLFADNVVLDEIGRAHV